LQADTPKSLGEIDEWIRHRLRAIQLKQWKRGRTAFHALRALGIRRPVAQGVARYCRSWWRNLRALAGIAGAKRHCRRLTLGARTFASQAQCGLRRCAPTPRACSTQPSNDRG
jgi:hypothetical protein